MSPLPLPLMMLIILLLYSVLSLRFLLHIFPQSLPVLFFCFSLFDLIFYLKVINFTFQMLNSKYLDMQERILVVFQQCIQIPKYSFAWDADMKFKVRLLRFYFFFSFNLLRAPGIFQSFFLYKLRNIIRLQRSVEGHKVFVNPLHLYQFISKCNSPFTILSPISLTLTKSYLFLTFIGSLLLVMLPLF